MPQKNKQLLFIIGIFGLTFFLIIGLLQTNFASAAPRLTKKILKAKKTSTINTPAPPPQPTMEEKTPIAPPPPPPSAPQNPPAPPIEDICSYDNIINNGLVGWWKGEGNATDSSSQKNDGSLIGTTFIAGVLGQAFSLDGQDDYVLIPESDTLNVSEEFTFSLFFRSNDQRLTAETKQREIFFRKGSNIMFGYEIDSKDYKTWLRFYVHYEDKTTQEVEELELKESGDNTTRDGLWHHFVITFKKDDYLRLYFDGRLVDEEKTPNKKIMLSSNSNDYVFGARIKNNGTVDRYLQEDIDDFMIFNRSLAACEVSTLYGRTIGLPK